MGKPSNLIHINLSTEKRNSEENKPERITTTWKNYVDKKASQKIISKIFLEWL